MRIGNLCVTRKNMGDSLMLPIPYTVSVAQAGSEYCYAQSQKCCWKGTTAKNCDSNNGGYSGCTRTVCNREAANEICAKFNYAGKTWRLATPDEAKSWFNASLGVGQNGLMLCNHAGDIDLARCDIITYCYGAYTDKCVASMIYSSADSNGILKAYLLDHSVYRYGSQESTYGTSVRCVTEMN